VDAPQCTRCSSMLVVRTRAAVPSGSVLELRGGGDIGEDPWLCSSCGHAWTTSPRPHLDRPPTRPDYLRGRFFRSNTRDADVAVRAPAAPTTSSHGAELRAARESSGRSLGELAAQTSIWARYLRALEADAPPSAFPAPAYARFFLREYADALGLDADALVERFDDRYPLEPDVEPPPLPIATHRWRRLVARSLVVLSLAALLAIAVIWSSGRDTGIGGTSALSAQADERAAANVTPGAGDTEPPAAPTPERHVRAVLRFTAPCWVAARADGELTAAETFDAGELLAVRADRIVELTLGNAGAVELVA